MNDEMKFINYIKPSLQEGKYSVSVNQSVKLPESQEFNENAEFLISGKAYSLGAEDVFSTFPADNEAGKFGDILPFLVTDKKTYPWDRKITHDINGIPVPWVALVVISENEGAEEKDISISDLLNKKESNIYFPDKSDMPTAALEKATDTCRVVDLPVGLYHEIMPELKDLPFLCHARSVNLSKTEDSICAKDGFFSVICANRFVPSGLEVPLKSTVHLVSLFGYANPVIPAECKKVRLVSLFRWNIFSQKSTDEDFESIINGLKKNCGVINYTFEESRQKQGYRAKKHITRSGEHTYSLYRPPLIPFNNTEKLKNSHTSDGHLIYDPQTGIFDVTCSAAWQLGRLITLNNPSISSSLLRYRKEQKIKSHHRMLRNTINFNDAKLEELTVRLTDENILSKGLPR